MTHFLERCNCGLILRQCRCPGPKYETVVQYPPCTHPPKDAIDPPPLRCIDDAVDEWHDFDTGMTLHEYLDMTWDEYKTWVEGRMTPDRLAEFGYRA